MKSMIKKYKHYTIFSRTFIIVLTTGLLMPLTSGTNADKPRNNKNEWVVVIDAGHGGKDSGAVGRRSMEKDIVLKIALKTGKYINELLEGVKVIYTRTDDEFVELYKRAEIANKAQADLFISIHCNGFGDGRI